MKPQEIKSLLRWVIKRAYAEGLKITASGGTLWWLNDRKCLWVWDPPDANVMECWLIFNQPQEIQQQLLTEFNYGFSGYEIIRQHLATALGVNEDWVDGFCFGCERHQKALHRTYGTIIPADVKTGFDVGVWAMDYAAAIAPPFIPTALKWSPLFRLD